MPAYYTIVQCVPDPIADERVNVGVIVVHDGEIRSRFVRKWRRIRTFAQHDIAYVTEFAARIERAAIASVATVTQPVMAGMPSAKRIDEAALRSMAENWSNSIQLTPLQPSLEHPDDLLPNLVGLFLRDPAAKQPRFRDRQDAARVAVRAVRSAVRDHLGAAVEARTVAAPSVLAGKLLSDRRVDLAIKNGRYYLASQSLSFETHDMAELDQQIEHAIYTLQDIHDRQGNLRIDVLALPPNPDLDGYRKAHERFSGVQQSCKRIGARLILEHDATEWADELASLVETEILGPGRAASIG